jgi:hypothetical protein
MLFSGGNTTPTDLESKEKKKGAGIKKPKKSFDFQVFTEIVQEQLFSDQTVLIFFSSG